MIISQEGEIKLRKSGSALCPVVSIVVAFVLLLVIFHIQYITFFAISQSKKQKIVLFWLKHSCKGVKSML